MDPLVLNINEAAALLGTSPKALYNLTRPRSRAIQAVPIPFFKMGKRLVFRREALEAWVKEMEEAR
jgi:excisionase family DNA binding protein